MGQYSYGTVSIAKGATVVTGVNTLWSRNVAAGNWFEILGEGLWYDVLSVDSDTQITLKQAYNGTTKANSNYTIQRDFTPYNGYPIPSYGDQDTGSLLSYALQSIDLQLAQIAPELSGVVNGTLQIQGQIQLSGTSFDFATLSTSGALITVASANTGAMTLAGLKVERSDADAYLAWNEGEKRWGSYTSIDGAQMSLADFEAKTVYGTVASPSDAKLKNITGPIRDALHRVGLLNGVRFTWTEEAKARGVGIDGVDVGLIAQDLERALPEAVERLDETRFVHYGKVAALLVEAVKELTVQNAELMRRVLQLEAVA